MARKKKTTQQAEQAPEQPINEQATETAEPIEKELTPTEKLINEFIEVWENKKSVNYLTDKEARQVHKIWQGLTGRTDYYTNCSVCTIAHIKAIKKIALKNGIKIQ